MVSSHTRGKSAKRVHERLPLWHFLAEIWKAGIDSIQKILFFYDFPYDSKRTQIWDKNSNNVQCNFAFIFCRSIVACQWNTSPQWDTSISDQPMYSEKMDEHLMNVGPVQHTACAETATSATWPEKSIV